MDFDMFSKIKIINRMNKRTNNTEDDEFDDEIANVGEYHGGDEGKVLIVIDTSTLLQYISRT